MSDAAPGHRAAEYGGDVVLDQEVGEALGTISAGEGDHGGRYRGGKEKCLRLPEATPGIA